MSTSGKADVESADDKTDVPPEKRSPIELKEIGVISTAVAALVGVGAILIQAMEAGFMPSFSLEDAAALLLSLLITAIAFYLLVGVIAVIPSIFLSHLTAVESDKEKNGAWADYVAVYYFLNVGVATAAGVLLALILHLQINLSVAIVVAAGSLLCSLYAIREIVRFLRSQVTGKLGKLGSLVIASGYTLVVVICLSMLVVRSPYFARFPLYLVFLLISVLVVITNAVWSHPTALWRSKFIAPTLIFLCTIPALSNFIFHCLGLANQNLQGVLVESDYRGILDRSGFVTTNDNPKYSLVTNARLIQRIGAEFIIVPQGKTEPVVVLPKDAVKSYAFATATPSPTPKLSPTQTVAGSPPSAASSSTP